MSEAELKSAVKDPCFCWALRLLSVHSFSITAGSDSSVVPGIYRQSDPSSTTCCIPPLSRATANTVSNPWQQMMKLCVLFPYKDYLW